MDTEDESQERPRPLSNRDAYAIVASVTVIALLVGEIAIMTDEENNIKLDQFSFSFLLIVLAIIALTVGAYWLYKKLGWEE